MTKVFISYSTSDRESAQRLSRELRDAGLETLIDRARTMPVERWRESIRKAIRESDYFIALVSSMSFSEGYFREELRSALDEWKERPERSRFILPVRLDDVIIASLSDLYRIDLFPSWESGFNALLPAIERLDPSRKVRPLTPREMEILRLIAGGLTSIEIARKLSLSSATVRNHVARLMKTLGVNSRSEAVNYASEKGWLLEQSRVIQNHSVEARHPTEVGSPTILVAWDPEVLTQVEYIELLTALADLVRAEGGVGIKRLDSEELEVPNEVGVLA